MTIFNVDEMHTVHKDAYDDWNFLGHMPTTTFYMAALVHFNHRFTHCLRNLKINFGSDDWEKVEVALKKLRSIDNAASGRLMAMMSC